MKLLNLRLKGSEDDPNALPSRDVLLLVMNAPAGSGGYKLPEQRKRTRIRRALRKVPEDGRSILLEDADFDFVRTAFENFPWAVSVDRITDIGDDFEAAVTAELPMDVPVKPPR